MNRSTRTSPKTETARLKIEIHGAVQGVGFRPFVYRLAAELDLTGWVINDTRGVFIEAESDRDTLQTFLARLAAETPPLAIVQTIDSEWMEPVGFTRFEIRHSEAGGAKTVLVLPDMATCADCLREVFDPADRRRDYAFTNCTNCGPRFSIIRALPYDRPNTTMRQFVMCPDCQAEYDSPLDRRFHAQPNACPVCGPQLEWRMANGERRMAGDEALRQTVTAILAGEIVAVKGLGGFHLMVDATNADAVALLRDRKPRRDKPFAVMAADLKQARQLCEIDSAAAKLLTAPQAPIVLLPKRADSPIAENVAPDNPTLGVMLPYTPLHHLLLREVGLPIVATSGNLTDEPICTDEAEAVSRLGHIADHFLIHNRPIERHVDDSVAWVIDGAPRLLRRARGYAPLPVLLPKPVPTILAVGAHLKNTVALSVQNQVFISQHIGDLETAESMAAFERVIADFQQLYEAEPVAIAHDLHPDYLSTKYANEQIGKSANQQTTADHSSLVTCHSSLELVAVQHHHAHLAACLAENSVDGSALGVTWDGTGYGLDGTIWGGEFLLGDANGFERVAHLRPFRLPGGDAAVKEPRRTALALLWEIFGEATPDRDDIPALQTFTDTEKRLLDQMLAKNLNSPVTTSAGRLFDGVAALIGLHPRVSFEGQAAMALEFMADKNEMTSYELRVTNEENSSLVTRHSSLVLDWEPMIRAILADLRRGIAPGVISARFHNTLVEGIVSVAQAVGQARVALSGGCFQNRRLTEHTARRLREAGFEVLLHRQVPPNDGGISLGQIAIAAAQLEKV